LKEEKPIKIQTPYCLISTEFPKLELRLNLHFHYKQFFKFLFNNFRL